MIVVENMPVGNVRFNPMDGLKRDAASPIANMGVRCKVRVSFLRRTSENPTQRARKTLILAAFRSECLSETCRFRGMALR